VSTSKVKWGASIAVFKGDAVLLVERGRAPWRRLWSLPGGSIERGETPSVAALRELKEETGIAAEIEGLLDSIELAAADDDGRPVTWRLAIFYGRYGGGSLQPGSDAANVRWVVLADLEALGLTEGTASLIRLAARRLGASSA
jgi:ADP-ribose pyrophosphatase YjhB (NUDIX family)